MTTLIRLATLSLLFVTLILGTTCLHAQDAPNLGDPPVDPPTPDITPTPPAPPNCAAHLPPFQIAIDNNAPYQDVGAGADGSIWAFAVDGVVRLVHPGSGTRPFLQPGFSTGNFGTQLKNNARIAVGPDGLPWVTDESHNIWRFSGYPNFLWTLMPGVASDIGIGANGSVWIIGTDSHIYLWTSNGWVQVSGLGTNITVGSDGQPWVTNSSKQIFHRNSDGSWGQFPGLANDISISPGGSLWVIGKDAAPAGGGNIIWHWSASGWVSDPNAQGGGRIASLDGCPGAEITVTGGLSTVN